MCDSAACTAKLLSAGLDARKHGFQAGGTITLFAYAGEGLWNFCSGDEVFQDEFSEIDPGSESPARTRQWYKITLKSGVSGYAPRENLDQNAPGCG